MYGVVSARDGSLSVSVGFLVIGAANSEKTEQLKARAAVPRCPSGRTTIAAEARERTVRRYIVA